MQRCVVGLVGLVLSVGMTWAASAVQQVTITVVASDMIGVPQKADLLLQTGNPGHRQTYRTQLRQPRALEVRHNLEQPRRVVAEALLVGPVPQSDITLICDVTAGGARPAKLVEKGAVSGPRDVLRSVRAGYNAFDITWRATATVEGTPAGTYGWNVRFTLTDD